MTNIFAGAEFPEIPVWKGEDFAFAHLKMDGWRLELITDYRGRTRALTRQYDNLIEVVPRDYLDWAKPGTQVFVEAWNEGQRAVKPRPGCKMCVIAAPFVGGEDCRHHILEDVAYMKKFPIGCGTLISRAVLQELHTLDPDKLQEEAERLGGEGWVFKQKHFSNWFKLKAIKTVDLRCVGFTPGKNKHTGKIGAIIGCLEDGTEVCKAGGMTDEERDDMTANQLAYVGRVFEVAYQLVGARGRLRHPRFVRWRDDLKEAQNTL